MYMVFAFNKFNKEYDKDPVVLASKLINVSL